MLEDFDCNAIHMQGSGKMTVQVKTPKEKQAVEVEEGATIKQVGGMDDFFISIDQESFISLETDADLLSFWIVILSHVDIVCMRHYSHDSNVCAFLFFHSFCVP